MHVICIHTHLYFSFLFLEGLELSRPGVYCDCFPTRFPLVFPSIFFPHVRIHSLAITLLCPFFLLSPFVGLTPVCRTSGRDPHAPSLEVATGSSFGGPVVLQVDTLAPGRLLFRIQAVQ